MDERTPLVAWAASLRCIVTWQKLQQGGMVSSMKPRKAVSETRRNPTQMKKKGGGIGTYQPTRSCAYSTMIGRSTTPHARVLYIERMWGHHARTGTSGVVVVQANMWRPS